MYNKFEVIALADSILRDKAKEFAKAVVFLCRDMKANHKHGIISMSTLPFSKGCSEVRAVTPLSRIPP